MTKFKLLTKSILFFFLVIAFNTTMYAAQINWDGGGDGVSWSDPANWDGDALPTIADNAVFPASLTEPLTVVEGTGPMNSVTGIWAFSGVDLTLDLDLTIEGDNAINSVRVFVGSALTFKSGRTYNITSSNRALIFWKENSSITIEAGAIVNLNAPTGVGTQGGSAVAAALHNYGTINFTTTNSAIRPNNVTDLLVTNYPCGVMNLGIDSTGSKVKFNAPSTLINDGLITYGGNGSAMSISTGGVVINNGFFDYENGSSFGLGDGTVTDNGINLNSGDTLVNAMDSCSVAEFGIAAAYDWYSDAAGTNIVGNSDTTGLLTFSSDAFMTSGTQIIYTSCYGSNVAIEVSNIDGSCIISNGQSDSVDITFLVNTANIMVDPTGIFLAGGGNFGNPGDNPMSDLNSDGVYEITVRQPKGFSSYYIFTNGSTGWENKEDLAGLPCADPNNFNDRFLDSVFSDMTLLTCYGTCAADTVCPPPATMIDLEVAVNMSQYAAAFTTVYISGDFNDWNGTANPLADQGSGLWTGTISVPENDSIEYKFTLDDWNAQENFEGGEFCTKTTGAFTNRFLTYSAENMTLDDVCWESCDDCLLSTKQLLNDDNLFTIQPNLLRTNSTTIYFSDAAANTQKTIKVLNAMGQVVFFINNAGNTDTYLLDVNHLQSGLYFINIQTEDKTAVKRLMIQR